MRMRTSHTLDGKGLSIGTAPFNEWPTLVQFIRRWWITDSNYFLTQGQQMTLTRLLKVLFLVTTPLYGQAALVAHVGASSSTIPLLPLRR